MGYKLGSLFDGSGGFPLAGALCGIEPIWASEVEPYPIAVTKSRFPSVKHLGDITKINGAEIEPVDIITFGSPCQDLSVAGKRAGLKHEENGDDETTRSGLFMEAVRIIKEMREKTNGEYPRFCCWENVPGAFSSNRGQDFRIVLEEIIKIVEPSAVMPAVPQKGWAYADSYCGDGWSLAYRVLDAQYWGVPQRRRRIYLVADFRGGCAREILFEREGLRGYFTKGRTPWKAAPHDAERSIGADDREGEIPYTLKIRSGVSVDSYGKGAGKGALIQKNLSATLGVSQDQYLFQPVGADIYNLAITGDVACSLTAEGYSSTGSSAKVLIPVATLEPGIAQREGGHIYEGVSGTLRANAGDNQMSVAYGIDHAITTGGNCTAQGPCVYEDVEGTLKASGVHAVAYGISAYESNAMKSSNPHSGVYEAETSRTLDLNGGNPACNQGGIAIVEPIAVATQQGGAEITDNGICPTITAAAGMSGNNQPWICQGLDAYNQSLTGSKAKTINSAASDADHVPCVVHCVDQGGGKSACNVTEEIAPTLTCTHGGEPAVCYSIENHPNDSRVKIDESGKVQALTSRMGTGGGNVPMVMEPFCKSRRAKSPDDFTTWKHGKVANTLNTFDQGETRVNELVVETVALEGNGQRPSHRGDGYAVTDKSYTLNSTEVHGVAYAIDKAITTGGNCTAGGSCVYEEVAPTLTTDRPHGVACPILHASKASFFMNAQEGVADTLVATDYKDPQLVAYSFDPGASRDVGALFIEECGKTITNGTCPGHHDGVVIAEQPIAIDRAFFNQGQNAQYEPQTYEDGTVPTLVAKGPGAVATRYIVRRLTPTECARLQGFADRWGSIEPKTQLSDEEYKFWLDVRKTSDAINGRAEKDYTPKQILTWYNKLPTDSAEYKMWGNGIALPTALYVLQGISEVGNYGT